jgi:hypothetical protein
MFLVKLEAPGELAAVAVEGRFVAVVDRVRDRFGERS